MQEKNQDESCFATCVPLARIDERVSELETKTVVRLEGTDRDQWKEINEMKKARMAILTGIILTLLATLGTLFVVLAKG